MIYSCGPLTIDEQRQVDQSNLRRAALCRHGMYSRRPAGSNGRQRGVCYFQIWNKNNTTLLLVELLLPAQWVECSPTFRETCVQSQVTSYQRLLKWHLIPPCLTLSNIRYVSRVKWSNPGKGVAPPLHLGVVAIEKGAFWSPSTTVANFTYFRVISCHIYIETPSVLNVKRIVILRINFLCVAIMASWVSFELI